MATAVSACTIVSANYITFAKVLAQSYLKHHPGHKFYVLLVDSPLYMDDLKDPSYELISVDDIPLPFGKNLYLAYTILELNTAVKPFFIEYLFTKFGCEKITYIDPDVLFFNSMQLIYDYLDDYSVVLTPHILMPYKDDETPSEVSILQSGTYNLGFIALKNSPSVNKLLRWWQKKNATKCIVDIKNGLFVDQKWIDLVPGYFTDIKICRDPGYNVAYWNLHERTIECVGKDFFSNQAPLVFFHFSGYDPKHPETISKHQTRHSIDSSLVLKKIFAIYKEALVANHYWRTSKSPYAYSRINEIDFTLPVRRVILNALEHGVTFPDPYAHPAEFLKFLFNPNFSMYSSELPPFYQELLKVRGDVYDLFVKNEQSKACLDEWLFSSGIDEYGVNVSNKHMLELLSLPRSVVSKIFNLVKDREDLQSVFGDWFFDVESFARLHQWLLQYGLLEVDISMQEINQLCSARLAPIKVVCIWLMRKDLQKFYPAPWSKKVLFDFCRYLRENLRFIRDLTVDDVDWFEIFCDKSLVTVNRLFFLYANCSDVNKLYNTEFALPQSSALGLIYDSSVCLRKAFPKAFDDMHDFEHFSEKLRDLRDYRGVSFDNEEVSTLQATSFNIAGYFLSPTGVGESSRSMLRKFSEFNIPTNNYCLPTQIISEDYAQSSLELMKQGFPLGWYSDFADVSIIVANGDSYQDLRSMLPSSFWRSKTTVGYWVWETSVFPPAHSNTLGLDEIWTPSQYSKEAISASVDIPVHVVPHLQNLSLIQQSRKKRSYFGLPENMLLFGFMFDIKSCIERKNPRALISAFKKAFNKDDNVGLVLKTDKPIAESFELSQLVNTCCDSNIFLYSGSFPQLTIYDLMQSLDVYISLHRSEGFGLTLLEAMTMGIPTVATNYSGNLEFMTKENSVLIDSGLIAVDSDVYPLSGDVWGDPDIEMAAQSLRSLKDENYRREVGEKGKASALNYYKEALNIFQQRLKSTSE